MNGEVDHDADKLDVEEDIESAEEPEDTTISEDLTDIDNVGDISVEIDVEELVAKIEAGDDDSATHRKEVRRQLDVVEEKRRSDEELGSTFNFNLDEDL